MRAFALVVLALVTACSPGVEPGDSNPDVDLEPASDVTLSVEPDQTGPGESVELVLHNGSPEPVGYNLCTSALEQRVDEAWTPVPSDRVCTMELRTLDPGREARFTLDLAADLENGTYRVVTNVERLNSGRREGVTSDPFEVG